MAVSALRLRRAPARWQQLTNTSSGTVRIARDLVAARGRCRPTARHRPAVASRAGSPCAGDVDDAVAPREQRVDHRLGLGVGLPSTSAVTRCGADAAGAAQQVGDRLRLGARARQRRVDVRSHAGSPITSTASSAAGVAAPARGRFRCAACAAACCGSPTAARRRRHGAGRAGGSSSSHGMQAVPSSSSSSMLAGAAEERLHLERHQQLEQRAADLRIAGRRRWMPLQQLAQQLALRRLRTHLGARAPGVERVGDRRFEIGGAQLTPGVCASAVAMRSSTSGRRVVAVMKS